MGLGRVYTEPKALAAGTAGTARGPAAVYSLHRPNRNETQSARPLLVGRMRVESEPTALAGGTAAS